MILLGRNKSKITKNENVKNVPYLEINEVILTHLLIVINKIQESCIQLFLINLLVHY